MKGLLMKDIQLLLANRRMFAVVAFCGVLMFFVEDRSMFVEGYITFVFVMQAINTIAYDQVENCDLYLFTLPVSRRQYVIEKYVFVLLFTGIGWAVSVLAEGIVHAVRGGGEPVAVLLAASVSLLAAACLLIAVFLPIQLRFGNEKGRMVVLAMVAVAVLGALAVKNLFAASGISLTGFLDWLLTQNWTAVLVTAGFAVLFLVSVLASMRVVRRKEF